MIFIYYKDFKILIIAQFGALAGQIQHMAAQKVRFTPRPIRYEPLNLHVSSSSPAALEYTYQIISYHIISYHIHISPRYAEHARFDTPFVLAGWCRACVIDV